MFCGAPNMTSVKSKLVVGIVGGVGLRPKTPSLEPETPYRLYPKPKP